MSSCLTCLLYTSFQFLLVTAVGRCTTTIQYIFQVLSSQDVYKRQVFLMPCAASLFTTLASVAMEAWSVPGTQQAFLPSMRARRDVYKRQAHVGVRRNTH